MNCISWIQSTLSGLIKKQTFVFLCFLFGVAILSFCLQMGYLGFYLDDWVIISAYQNNGAQGIYQYTSEDSRPLVAWIWILESLFFNTNPLGWQLFALGFRSITIYATWITLNKILTNRVFLNGAICLLFFVYPIFTQQSMAVTYSAIWVMFSLFIFSIYLQILALEKKAFFNGYLFLSLALNAVQLFSQEYLLGLELSRFLIIYIYLQRQTPAIKPSKKFLILIFLPYILLLGLFILWRFFLIDLPVADRNTPQMVTLLIQNPLYSLRRWIEMGVQSMIEAFWGSWYKALDPKSFVLKPLSNATGWIISSILMVVLALNYWKKIFYPQSIDKKQPSESKGLILIGLLMAILGFIPGWGIGRTIADPTGLYNDRFGIASMLGCSIALVGLIELCVFQSKLKYFILGSLISVGIGYQYRSQTNYVNSWIMQNNFIAQLTTRIPDLEPHTSIISNQVTAKYMGSWADVAILNLIYDRNKLKADNTISYWYFTTGNIPLDYLREHQYLLFEKKKFFNFTGDLRESIVIMGPSANNCLWIIDTTHQNNPYIDPSLRPYLQFSKPERIKSTPIEANISPIFNLPKEKDWCTNYHKAGLLYQMKQYSQVVDIFLSTLQAKQIPKNHVEYVVFIQAYAKTGLYKEALELTKLARKPIQSPYISLEPYLCSVWDGLLATSTSPSNIVDEVANLKSQLGCK